MKTRSQIAVEALDEVAARMESKWGVGRLPKLVPVDLAERYWRQLDKLNAAITDEATGGSVANVEYEAGRMRNAWTVLDATAEAAGALPLSPRTLEARLEDGRLLVISGDPEGAWQAARDNRSATVWTVEEIARVLWQFEMVNEAKRVFPGATVTAARVDPERLKPPIDWTKGDDLPEGLRAWGAG